MATPRCRTRRNVNVWLSIKLLYHAFVFFGRNNCVPPHPTNGDSRSKKIVWNLVSAVSIFVKKLPNFSRFTERSDSLAAAFVFVVAVAVTAIA